MKVITEIQAFSLFITPNLT